MNIQATRLRFITGRDKSLVSKVISGLDFKIEIKSIVEEKGRTTVWFVIPDSVKEFNNIDLKNVE